ncbi:MAG: transposase [Thermodesulfovibrionales bacterium]
MKYEPDKHHRQSIRLKGYDYSQAGAYFVTICTQNRECLFGDSVSGAMRLNDAGQMVRAVWNKIPDHFPNADIDESVVMPNHFHGIIIINTVGAQFIAPCDRHLTNQNNKEGAINHAPTPVGEIVRALKARCTHAINQIQNTPGHPVWQRNYYEQIIRSEEGMNRIRQYISENPMGWSEDENNPAVFCKDRNFQADSVPLDMGRGMKIMVGHNSLRPRTAIRQIKTKKVNKKGAINHAPTKY